MPDKYTEAFLRQAENARAGIKSWADECKDDPPLSDEERSRLWRELDERMAKRSAMTLEDLLAERRAFVAERERKKAQEP